MVQPILSGTVKPFAASAPAARLAGPATPSSGRRRCRRLAAAVPRPRVRRVPRRTADRCVVPAAPRRWPRPGQPGRRPRTQSADAESPGHPARHHARPRDDARPPLRPRCPQQPLPAPAPPPPRSCPAAPPPARPTPGNPTTQIVDQFEPTTPVTTKTPPTRTVRPAPHQAHLRPLPANATPTAPPPTPAPHPPPPRTPSPRNPPSLGGLLGTLLRQTRPLRRMYMC